MKPLSPMQQRIYDEIAAFQKAEGYTPTLRTLGEMLNLSQFTVAHHVNKIVEKGRARRTDRKRHIILT